MSKCPDARQYSQHHSMIYLIFGEVMFFSKYLKVGFTPGKNMLDNAFSKLKLTRCGKISFYQLSEIPGSIVYMYDKPLCDLLLFGDSQHNVIFNRIILEATIYFINKREKFFRVNLSTNKQQNLKLYLWCLYRLSGK